MNDAGLLDETRRAWSGSSPLVRIVEGPRPGDVFALAELAEHDVEWAVLEREELTGRLLVVAADGQPLVGSMDVEVPASQPGGPLVLRCRFGGWVDAERLAAAVRTGSLEPGALARARERRAMAAGSSEPAAAVSELALEVDDETPYLSWVRENLEPAWTAMARLEPVAARPRSERRRTRRPGGRRPRYGTRVLTLAATVLLAVTATTFWLRHRESLGWRNAVQDSQRTVEALRREQERLASEHRRELDEAQARHEQLETESRRRLDELGRRLEALSGQNAVFNPVVESLEPPRGRRGGTKTVKLHAGASHLLLAVALEGSGRLYRAELLNRATGEVVWEKSGLEKQPLGLWIGPPAALIPPGEYLLRLFDETQDTAEPAAEYPLNITYEQQRTGNR